MPLNNTNKQTNRIVSADYTDETINHMGCESSKPT